MTADIDGLCRHPALGRKHRSPVRTLGFIDHSSTVVDARHSIDPGDRLNTRNVHNAMNVRDMLRPGDIPITRDILDFPNGIVVVRGVDLRAADRPMTIIANAARLSGGRRRKQCCAHHSSRKGAKPFQIRHIHLHLSFCESPFGHF
jgi:hypothetical protein